MPAVVKLASKVLGCCQQISGQLPAATAKKTSKKREGRRAVLDVIQYIIGL